MPPPDAAALGRLRHCRRSGSHNSPIIDAKIVQIVKGFDIAAIFEEEFWLPLIRPRASNYPTVQKVGAMHRKESRLPLNPTG
jgi:hypothetical protein